MKKTCLLAVAAGMACCSTALAKPPLETIRAGVKLEPIAMAKVAKVNGQVVLASDWMPYTGGFGTRSGGPINAPFFDSFGREPGTAPTGGAGTQCSVGCTTQWGDLHTDTGIRWYFGTGYHNPNTVEDMQNINGAAGAEITRVDLGWFWGPPAAERCLIVYFPFEDILVFDPVGGACNDPATFTVTGAGGGVIIDFGILAPGTPFYYYSIVAGLDGLGMVFPVNDPDANGKPDGSYQQILANDFVDTDGDGIPDTLILAAGPTQPMLWGTGDNNEMPGRPGHNNEDSYDDDAPTDGVLGPAECYSYAFGICPDPLGKMSAFSWKRCPSDLNGDGFVDGIDADYLENTFNDGDPLVQSQVDLNGDCFVDGLDYDAFYNDWFPGC